MVNIFHTGQTRVSVYLYPCQLQILVGIMLSVLFTVHVFVLSLYSSLAYSVGVVTVSCGIFTIKNLRLCIVLEFLGCFLVNSFSHIDTENHVNLIENFVFSKISSVSLKIKRCSDLYDVVIDSFTYSNEVRI